MRLGFALELDTLDLDQVSKERPGLAPSMETPPRHPHQHFIPEFLQEHLTHHQSTHLTLILGSFSSCVHGSLVPVPL